jgi:hypothetical protein
MRLTTNMRRSFPLIVALGFLGCSPAVMVKPQDYREAPLPAGDVKPADVDSGARAKIVLLPSDDTALNDKKGAIGAAGAMVHAIETSLSEGGAEIIDRTLNEKLGKEIELAIFTGKASYKGPAVASYAVKGIVGNADYRHQFFEAHSYGTRTIPAHCDHKVAVNQSIRVYEMPTLRLVTTINAPGAGATTTQGRCNDSQGPGLARLAVDSGVHEARHDLNNVFAPKGYVIEKRVHDGMPTIFRVTMGSGQGATAQSKVVFYSIRKTDNAAAGKTIYDEEKIGEGSISDQISEGYCWVVASGEETAKAVRLYDFVRVVHEMSFGEKIKKQLH